MPRTYAARLASILVLLGACTSDPATGPSPDLRPTPALVGDLTGTVETTTATTLSTVTGLLLCSPENPATTTATIGPKGGVIRVGQHELSIPARALRAPVQITAEVVQGTANTVRFSPHGLTFARQATLTLGYGNCQSVAAPKKIAYTTEALRILEVLQSLDAPRTASVSAEIDHFSRYAVAW
jgi:hypothetical protein